MKNLFSLQDFDLQKRALNELQQENNQLKEILASREKLIQVNLFIMDFFRLKTKKCQ